MEKATLSFRIYKIWQILKRFAGTFRRANTLKLWGVPSNVMKIARFWVWLTVVPEESLEFFGNINVFKLHPSSEQWLQMKSSFDTSTKSGLQSNSISDCLPQPPNQYSYKKNKKLGTRLGILIRNMKMVLNIYGTWHRVMFEKLMMKIYDFFLFS